MPDVVIYTSNSCSFCYRAKQLLRKKGVDFVERSVDFQPELRKEMTRQCGRTSVPQIWIGTQHIGGCEDIYALERNGQLDAILFQ